MSPFRFCRGACRIPAVFDKFPRHLVIKVDDDRLGKVLKFFAEGSYTSEKFAGKVKEFLEAEVEIAKCIEWHLFAVIPKCWAVKRSLGWLEANVRTRFFQILLN
jgi:hypothetical protein